jgi:hypothetical protein
MITKIWYTVDMPFISDLWGKFKEKAAALFKRERLVKFFEEKKRLVLIGAGFVLLLFALALVTILLIVNTGRKKEDKASIPVMALPAVPPGEFFLPSEPDFIPDVLLERQSRGGWETGDAAPYWKDPLKQGEQPWRDRVETVIDELLERVP